MVKTIIYKVSFPLVLIIITLGSVLPSQEIANLNLNIWDKGAHFFMYFGFALTLYMFLKYGGIVNIKNRLLITTVIISILYGVLMEVIQYYFIEGRYGDSLDVIANSIGVIMALFSILLFNYIKFKFR